MIRIESVRKQQSAPFVGPEMSESINSLTLVADWR